MNMVVYICAANKGKKFAYVYYVVSWAVWQHRHCKSNVNIHETCKAHLSVLAVEPSRRAKLEMNSSAKSCVFFIFIFRH